MRADLITLRLSITLKPNVSAKQVGLAAFSLGRNFFGAEQGKGHRGLDARLIG